MYAASKIPLISYRRYLLLAAVVVVAIELPAQAQAGWRSIRGADLRPLFVHHELADGVHYAYQFRDDGTFAGFNMGKEIGGAWRIWGNEFCWTQKRRGATEECFEVERSGDAIRLLRDGYEVLSAKLTPTARSPKEAPR